MVRDKSMDDTEEIETRIPGLGNECLHLVLETNRVVSGEQVSGETRKAQALLRNVKTLRETLHSADSPENPTTQNDREFWAADLDLAGLEKYLEDFLDKPRKRSARRKPAAAPKGKPSGRHPRKACGH
jgi:hypothetical protein